VQGKSKPPALDVAGVVGVSYVLVSIQRGTALGGSELRPTKFESERVTLGSTGLTNTNPCAGTCDQHVLTSVASLDGRQEAWQLTNPLFMNSVPPSTMYISGQYSQPTTGCISRNSGPGILIAYRYLLGHVVDRLGLVVVLILSF
jgi:hypothetical protein